MEGAEEPEQRYDFSLPNAHAPRLCLSAPFTTHSSRFRLSATYFSNRGPVTACRKLAWVSLEGRIVGAAEAASARAVGRGHGREEAVAWEIFSPMQRVLLVAVVAVAVGRAKDPDVARLRRSVEIRDELLLCMQRKLDDLCAKMNPAKEQRRNDRNFSNADEKNNDVMTEGLELSSNRLDDFSVITESAVAYFAKTSSEGEKNIIGAQSRRNEKFKTPQFSTTGQEERRMSDLSDLFSSAASSVDIQMSALSEQQDCYNLRRECDEKGSTIKELTAAILRFSLAESKKVAELEDIIKRRNLVITKLRKDQIFLEKKVIHLTRIRRPSFSASNSKADEIQLPLMSTNILYDICSSSLSSSDSDGPESTTNVHFQEDNAVSLNSLASGDNQMSSSSTSSMNRTLMPKPSNHRKVNGIINISDCAAVFKQKQMVSFGDSKRTKTRDCLERKRRDSRRRFV